jgi:biotin synthase
VSESAFASVLEQATACPKSLDRSQVASLLNPPGPDQERMLWQAAHLRRVATMGKCVHMRAIIEFSNYCRQDCLYCGLRRSNDRVARYRMSSDEIVDAALEAYSIHPFGTFVLQSGEDPGYDLGHLAVAVRRIADMTRSAVTLSIGQMTDEDYSMLREAGADRFLLKFETSDARLFRHLKPTTTLEQRLGCLDSLRKMGYQIGSGIILGLPGQNRASVADDLLLCRDGDYEMVSIGPFIPHPDTPLGQAECTVERCMEATASVRPTINAVAVARLLVPYAHMPATTALAVLGREDDSWRENAPSSCLTDARSLALAAGANVLMLDVTPARYREFYAIYPGKSGADGDVVSDFVVQAKANIHALGMTICPGRGDSPKMPWGRGDSGVGR